MLCFCNGLCMTIIPLILWCWCCWCCCNKLNRWTNFTCYSILCGFCLGRHLLLLLFHWDLLLRLWHYLFTHGLLYSVSSFHFYKCIWLNFLSFSTWTYFILIEVQSIKTILRSYKRWIIAKLYICFLVWFQLLPIVGFIYLVFIKQGM